MEPFYREENYSGWKCVRTHIENLVNAKGQSIWRGVKNSDYRLESTFDRLRNRLEGARPEPGDKSLLVRTLQLEDLLIREFKRRFHHHSSYIPNDTLEWLSYMRHHGSPTRLMDWTYSPYVALYFALEGFAECGSCTVWTIDEKWIGNTSIELLESARKKNVKNYLSKFIDDSNALLFDAIFLSSPQVKCVAAVNPLRMNPRLSNQRALFLCQGDIVHSFHENLAAHPDCRDNVTKIRLNLTRTDAVDGLRWLHRMGISRESLLPGLDGYAESLAVYHPLFENFWFSKTPSGNPLWQKS